MTARKGEYESFRAALKAMQARVKHDMAVDVFKRTGQGVGQFGSV